MLPQSLGLDHHANAVASLYRGDGLNGGTKVRHVQAAAQALRQAAAKKLHHQVLPLLTDVDAHLVVRQVDDHTTSVFYATPKIDVPQRQRGHIAAFRKRTHRGSSDWRRSDLVQRHQQRTSLNLSTVVGWLVEIKYHARAISCLRHLGHPQVAVVQFNCVALQIAGNAGKIQRNSRRRLNHETSWHRRQRFAELNTNDLSATLNRTGDGLNARLRLAHANDA